MAPCGSIGTMLNVSTGIEPWFATHYTRNTKSLNGGQDASYEVWAPVVKEAMDKNWLVGKDNKLPWHFKEDLIYYIPVTKVNNNKDNKVEISSLETEIDNLSSIISTKEETIFLYSFVF